jgi:hypothetical protein
MILLLLVRMLLLPRHRLILVLLILMKMKTKMKDKVEFSACYQQQYLQYIQYQQPVCQQLYVNSGNKKMVLYLLSIGLKKNSSKPLVAFDKEPWCSFPKNLFRSPKNANLVKEICRRADLSRNMTSLARPTTGQGCR